MNQPKNNHRNDRVKRDYLIWLKEAKQRSDATVEQARHAIDRLEAYTKFKDFATFNKEQAIGFKHALLESKSQRTGKPISISTVHHTLQAIKEFLAWLHGRQEYRCRIKPADVAYLNLTTGEERQAHTSGPKQYATLEEYRTALFAMPTETEIERRDQAIMALMLLTCMRDAAVISLKLKHINIARRHVFQDAREVNTKFKKTIETTFYPVGEDVDAIITDWVDYLVNKKDFLADDPLFPQTVNGHDEHRNFVPEGLGREHWANATAVRKIFRTAFERVGLPYVKPHTIRDTLTQLAYKLQLTGEELKAWSQNMGHDSLLTTMNSYGHISSERQAEIIGGLGKKPPATVSDDSMAESIARKVAAMLESSRR
ncbi:MAG: tyrosine-type recombinase/integrase [Rickettsiales bacterium]